MSSTTAHAPPAPSSPDDGLDRIRWRSNIPFWVVHVTGIGGVIYLGWSWSGFALAMSLFALRMFGITGSYHRYFAHRSFKTSRAFQFVLGLIGVLATQKGPLWWASHHRRHHKYSDQPEDIHSPVQRGFLWSHFLWILVKRHEKGDYSNIKDLTKYPELVWLDKWENAIVFAQVGLLYLIGGGWAVIWGYCFSTTLSWHCTFCINSLTHMFGRRRYKTSDDSRNSMILALLTFGEGWHNNHHYYQRSANMGFYWWEIDITLYMLRALSAVGLVWDLHMVPKHVRDQTAKALRVSPAMDATAAPVAADPVSEAA